MKNFYYQLLQQLNAKKSAKGFTLIELLVVIIIIGILSAIALPAFLNQANKARQSEAKQALGAINRGQQAYYLEKQLFSENIFGLGLGLQLATENYSYGNSNLTNSYTAANVDDSLGFTAGGGVETGGTTYAEGNKADRNGFDGYTSYSTAFAIASNQEAVRDYMGLALLVPGDGTNEATTIAVLCEEEDLSIANSDGTNGFDFLHAEIEDLDGPDVDVSCRGDVAADEEANVGRNAQNVGQ
ncbi:type IV pilin-like G/H family protein [[Limnothrix rosea] IAM M-220]|uniref:type IV pilin-like G/H family protein n=1 Tax=[Limnothrix rosea] IAM M-220 TaxID=454133 RepID=UPI000959AD93|nr:type IV pilin-like G/H family protein [[Limnothrix rosea] IAM M-220]OKH18449.1 hypothetical protein NIES208_05675 [[Limnothrix rosea] IAM M-220]